MGEVRQNRKSIQSHPGLNYKTIKGKAIKTTAREAAKKTTKLKHEN